MSSDQLRTYLRTECAVFRKTAEAFGGLSNMAPGFPVRVNGERILTVEALYQACRFPHRPEVQRLILEQSSPMTAKMVSKPYRNDSRADWKKVRVSVMRWCLRLKLAQHGAKFSQLLLSTGDFPIVEDSRKDDFWGAIPSDSKTLVGMNVLGRLLMELRESIKNGDELRCVVPPEIPNFLLFGEPLQIVDFRADKSAPPPAPAISQQLPLFDDAFKSVPKVRKPEVRSIPASKKEAAVIADLNPYPEYKDSGLPWLGKVPQHWEARPAFGAFEPNRERNFGMKEKTVLSLSYGRIIIKPAEKLHGLVPESFETYQIVNPGDIVIRTTDLQNDHTSLRVGMVRNRGIITSAYLALKLKAGVIPEFGFQFLNVWDTSKAIYEYGSGLRQNLDFSHFKRMPVALPPPEEQAAIVRFLDWANGLLERTIRAKRKIITLLNEQKQAIIHRAVTRGLNPNVPLKDSGIPWLGKIPEHWEMPLNQRIFKEKIRSHGDLPETQLSLSQRAGLIASKDMQERSLQTSSYNNWKVTVPGDLVLNRFKAHLGVFFASTLRGIVSFHYGVFAPQRVLHAKYFELLFHTYPYRAIYAGCSNGMTVGLQNLSNQNFYNVRCVVPPVVEQIAIVAYAERETRMLNTAINRLEREIELLREYRTRLVADVVTGKLDVREAAAKLPAPPADAFAESAPDDPLEEIDDELEETNNANN